jgi:type 1 glutamine amidotransferase
MASANGARSTLEVAMRMLITAALYVTAVAVCGGQAPNKPDRNIRVLVVTATQGWRHTEPIDVSKKRLEALDTSAGFRFEFTEDPAALNAKNLSQFDVLFLNNSTLRIAPTDARDSASLAALRWPPKGLTNAVNREQQEAIASFVREGKGLVVVHSGIDAFYGWPEYREMVGGGLFQNHPFTRDARVTIEDPKNPSVSHLGQSVNYKEEYYYLDKNPRPTSHVLASLDLTSVGDTTHTDHPLMFIRRYGKGRVYVNLLGHFGDTWKRDDYFNSVLQGIRIAAGRVPADFSVNSR